MSLTSGENAFLANVRSGNPVPLTTNSAWSFSSEPSNWYDKDGNSLTSGAPTDTNGACIWTWQDNGMGGGVWQGPKTTPCCAFPHTPVAPAIGSAMPNGLQVSKPCL